MGRAPCCDKANVKRGPWSPEEDAILKAFIDQHGTGGNWITLPMKAGLKRCGKSCRLRWINYLRPGIKRGGFTDEEEALIYKLHGNFGSRWSLIAAQLPGRTDNDIKNYWNTRMKRKLSIKSTEYSNMQLAVHVIPFRNEAGKFDPQPNVISPSKTFAMSNGLVCNQLPVEEMLQRIENSLQSCISTNSLESSCSRTSTERTNNAAQSTIRNSFPAFSNENDRITSVEEAYQYVLPALPCSIDEFCPKPLDFAEKSQPFYQILDRPTNRQLDSLGIDDTLKQYLAAQFVNKNFNVVIDEFYNVDTSRLNPLVSPTELPTMWKGNWSPRFC